MFTGKRESLDKIIIIQCVKEISIRGKHNRIVIIIIIRANATRADLPKDYFSIFIINKNIEHVCLLHRNL